MAGSVSVDLFFEWATTGGCFTFVGGLLAVGGVLTVGVKGFIFPAAFGLGAVRLASADLCLIFGALLTLSLATTVGAESGGVLGFNLKVPLGCCITSLGVMTFMISAEFV